MKTKKTFVLLLALCYFISPSQNMIITEKPLSIEDTILTSLTSITEVDVTSQFAYGVIKIDDADFFDLFEEPSGNNLFLYNSAHKGKYQQVSRTSGAIGWNCWYGALNQTKVKALLELKTKNQTSPGELSLFAVNYSADGTGSTYVYFDLLPDVNAASSFPDFQDNPFIKSSVDAVNTISTSDKPKDANVTINIEYTNKKGELKKISQAFKFKNSRSQYLFEERYPTKNSRKQKHYIHSELASSYLQNNFDEAKAEISKGKAIELFEQAQAGAKIKFISYAQTYTTKNETNGMIKSKAARCQVVYTQNNKCYFGQVYYRKINQGNGVFSDAELERFDYEGEVNCEKVK